jgi:hypothetical protein
MNRTVEELRAASLYRSITHRLTGVLLAISSLTLGAVACGSEDPKGGAGDSDDDDDDGAGSKKDAGRTTTRDPVIDVCADRRNKKVDKQRASDAGAADAGAARDAGSRAPADAGSATPRPTDAGTPAAPPAAPAPAPADAGSAGASTPPATGGSRTIFTEDFEKPKMALMNKCGEDLLDQREINDVFGRDGFNYVQNHTVETVLIDGNKAGYSDPKGTGGSYALGMLSNTVDDLLALSFKTTLPYLNVGLDITAVDLRGCNENVSADEPQLQVAVYETPEGGYKFDAANLGPVLERVTLRGKSSRDGKTFDFSTQVVALDATRVKSGNITLVFDALRGGYVVFDNLSIVESSTPGVIDGDRNGVPDDEQCAGKD